ncbi:MAG: glutathione S-transferase, partial [Bradyrhizobium icense]
MHVPSITAFYLAILALIYAALALRVAGLRRASRTLFGDADNTKLRAAIRVHANFIEYVPIIALLVALLEMSGMPTTRVHLLMGALLLTRLLHPIGMSARPRTWQFNAGR